MNFNIASTLEHSGEQMVQLLNYCIYSRKLDPVFILLAKNYQLMPNSAKALSLFDEFIATNAPLTLSIKVHADLQLVQTVDKIRNLQQLHNPFLNTTRDASQPDSDSEDAENPAYLPTKFLFSGLQGKVTADTAQIQSIESEYDPAHSAVQNLPDGKLSGAQLQYVEHVWRPARARLATAGFRMVANIGG